MRHIGVFLILSLAESINSHGDINRQGKTTVILQQIDRHSHFAFLKTDTRLLQGESECAIKAGAVACSE